MNARRNGTDPTRLARAAEEYERLMLARGFAVYGREVALVQELMEKDLGFLPTDRDSRNLANEVEISLTIDKIEGRRLSPGVKPESSVTFDVHANLVEESRGEGFFSLSFEINLTSIPASCEYKISGLAEMIGEHDDIEPLLTPPDASSPPPVFMKIYTPVYSMIYITALNMKLPLPSPGLMKVVKSVSETNIGSSKPKPPYAEQTRTLGGLVVFEGDFRLV